jgi:hypothetical protein
MLEMHNKQELAQFDHTKETHTTKAHIIWTHKRRLVWCKLRELTYLQHYGLLCNTKTLRELTYLQHYGLLCDTKTLNTRQNSICCGFRRKNMLHCAIFFFGVVLTWVFTITINCTLIQGFAFVFFWLYI